MGRTHDDEHHLAADLAKGAVAGVLAGLAASFVMNEFQGLWTTAEQKLHPGEQDSQGEPANEQAADKLSQAATGRPISPERKPAAGMAVHYGAGALLGALYGVVAEVAPAATAGGGALYGTVVNFVLDDAVVPALGLGPSPFKTPAKTHVYGLASHSAFGVALELVRRAVRGAI